MTGNLAPISRPGRIKMSDLPRAPAHSFRVVSYPAPISGGDSEVTDGERIFKFCCPLPGVVTAAYFYVQGLGKDVQGRLTVEIFSLDRSKTVKDMPLEDGNIQVNERLAVQAGDVVQVIVYHGSEKPISVWFSAIYAVDVPPDVLEER